MSLTDAQLKKIMPHSTARNRALALPVINKTARDYDISNERRMSGWLATLAIESGELKYQEEIASGSAYEGRADLGNTQKGDGKRFKGHGRIQITGRSNHASYTNFLKKNKHLPFVDFVAEPHRLAEEPYATDSAGWFWAIKVKNNAAADQGDFLTTQIRVNGRNKKTGLPNHWKERQHYYAKALSVLPDDFKLDSAASHTSAIQNPSASSTDQGGLSSTAADKPLLKMGSKGEDVVKLQELLGVTADGDFGKDTYEAVWNFQFKHSLERDGKVGPETWAALETVNNDVSSGAVAGGSSQVKIDGDKIEASTNTPPSQNVVIEKESPPVEEKPKGFVKKLWLKITTALGLSGGTEVVIEKAQQAQALGLSEKTWTVIFWIVISGLAIWVLYHFFIDKVWPVIKWLISRIRTHKMMDVNSTATNTVLVESDPAKIAELEKAGWLVVRRG